MKNKAGIMLIPFMSILLTGCGNKYNCDFKDDVGDLIKDSFAENNKINIHYDDGFYDETAPLERYFVIKDNETFDEVFTSSASELKADFSTSMIVVYTFSYIYTDMI